MMMAVRQRTTAATALADPWADRRSRRADRANAAIQKLVPQRPMNARVLRTIVPNVIIPLSWRGRDTAKAASGLRGQPIERVV